jgi:hypothetical protein
MATTESQSSPDIMARLNSAEMHGSLEAGAGAAVDAAARMAMLISFMMAGIFDFEAFGLWVLNGSCDIVMWMKCRWKSEWKVL